MAPAGIAETATREWAGASPWYVAPTCTARWLVTPDCLTSRRAAPPPRGDANHAITVLARAIESYPMATSSTRAGTISNGSRFEVKVTPGSGSCTASKKYLPGGSGSQYDHANIHVSFCLPGARVTISGGPGLRIPRSPTTRSVLFSAVYWPRIVPAASNMRKSGVLSLSRRLHGPRGAAFIAQVEVKIGSLFGHQRLLSPQTHGERQVAISFRLHGSPRFLPARNTSREAQTPQQDQANDQTPPAPVARATGM